MYETNDNHQCITKIINVIKNEVRESSVINCSEKRMKYNKIVDITVYQWLKINEAISFLY